MRQLEKRAALLSALDLASGVERWFSRGHPSLDGQNSGQGLDVEQENNLADSSAAYLSTITFAPLTRAL